MASLESLEALQGLERLHDACKALERQLRHHKGLQRPHDAVRHYKALLMTHKGYARLYLGLLPGPPWEPPWEPLGPPGPPWEPPWPPWPSLVLPGSPTPGTPGPPWEPPWPGSKDFPQQHPKSDKKLKTARDFREPLPTRAFRVPWSCWPSFWIFPGLLKIHRSSLTKALL